MSHSRKLTFQDRFKKHEIILTTLINFTMRQVFESHSISFLDVICSLRASIMSRLSNFTQDEEHQTDTTYKLLVGEELWYCLLHTCTLHIYLDKASCDSLVYYFKFQTAGSRSLRKYKKNEYIYEWRCRKKRDDCIDR